MKNKLISNLKLLFLFAVFSFIHNIVLGQSLVSTADTVSQGQTEVVYTVPVINNATGYIWTLPAGATITAGANTNSITVSFSTIATSGNVTVQGTNSCGNGTVSTDFVVIVNPLINITTITTEPGDQTACVGSSASFSVTATGGCLTYQWRKGTLNLTDGGNISGTNTDMLTINPIDISDTASNYNVVVMGTCSSNDTSINVSLFVNPAPVYIANSNSLVCVGSPIYLSAQTFQGGTYQWTGTNGYSSSVQNSVILSASFADEGAYSLIVSANGCPLAFSTVTVIINDCSDFNIPEGFSPNGDGINDLFVIRGIENYPDNSIVIFNRWGNKVFEASPYQNTWDGKCIIGLRVGGDILPIGTYFYILDLGNSSDVIKGNIYLNR